VNNGNEELKNSGSTKKKEKMNAKVSFFFFLFFYWYGAGRVPDNFQTAHPQLALHRVGGPKPSPWLVLHMRFIELLGVGWVTQGRAGLCGFALPY
jgi:hypothetical protein